MKKSLMLFLIILLIGLCSLGAVTRTIKINGTGYYSSIALAVADINSTLPAGGVTVNIEAGYTETIASRINLTKTGTVTDQIIFQKDPATTGANPKITAYVGTSTPGSAVPDGMWSLVGSDYVTIDGIDLYDPNTTGNAMMEYGYGLFKASVTDGCQYNTIKNCVIQLSNNNYASGSGANVEGSIGINVINALITAVTAVTPTTAAGTNSYNKFYTNTIMFVNYGIVLNGYAASSPFTLGDTANDIGGTASGTGNFIYNFGNSASTSNPAAGIRANNQWGINISYNTLNNNDATSGASNHGNTLRGIFAQAGTSASATIDHNTINLKGGGTTSSIYAIDNGIGSTASSNTVNITNNNITGSYSTATSGTFYATQNTAIAATVNMNNNIIHDISTPGTGAFYGVYSSASAGTNAFNANSNSVYNITKTGIGTIYAMRFGTATITASSNTIYGLSCTAASSTAAIYGIYSYSSPVLETYNSNVIHDFSSTGTATLGGIYFYTSAGNKTLQNNQIYLFTVAGAGSIYGIYKNAGATDDISGNLIHDFTITGAASGSIWGINNIAGTTISIYNNKIYTLSNAGGTGGSLYGIYSSVGTLSVYKNKIGDLSSGSSGATLYGMYVTGGTTNNISNNIIGDLRTPALNAGISLVGLYIAGGSTNNIYYNTVNLSGTSSGALFGSAAIYASTTPTVNLRNNIFVNATTPTGAGYAVAYRRSSATLTSYAATSNNNLFYGTSGIMYDSATLQNTLGAYKFAVTPRDANSFFEPVTYTSTTGTATDFLHINATVPTSIESGAAEIATFTDDYDGQARATAPNFPDIGADEGAFTIQIACSEPLFQPTALIFGTPLSTSLSGSFTGAGSRVVNDYLVVANLTSAEPWGWTPTDGSSYAPGSTVGTTGIIATKTGLLTFNATGLTASTNYTFRVYSVNTIGSGTNPNYLISNVNATGPLTGTKGTLVTAPTVPTSVTPSAPTISTITLAVVGNGTNDVILVWAPTSTFGTPSSAVSYSVGTPVTGGGTVLYMGPAAGITSHTGLVGNKAYYYKAWSQVYDSSNSMYVYSTTGVASIPAYVTTTGINPTGALTATAVSTTQINLSTTPNTDSDEIYVAWNLTGTFGTPSIDSTYTVGANMTNGKIMYVGAAAGLTSHTGLTAGTKYYYKVWSKRWTNTAWTYSTTSIIANATTLAPSYNGWPTAYTESFDGTTFAPQYWQNTPTNGTTTWVRLTAGTNPAASPHSGAGLAEYHSFNNSGYKCLLITQPMNFPTDTYRMKFWMYRDGTAYPTNADLVNVYFSTTNTITTGATLLGTVNRSISLAPVVASTGWYQYGWNMPAGSAGDYKYIIFEGVSTAGDNMFIDDVLIEPQPAVGVVTIDPNPIAFGNGYLTLTKTTEITLSNSGAGQLNVPVGGITLTGDAAFTLGTLPSLPLSLAPGAHVHFNVSYAPTTAAANTGVLHVNDGTNDVTTNISGTGVAGTPGVSCEMPYVITSLPLTAYAANTSTFFDDYSSAMITPSSTYMTGNDWVGQFTLAADSKLTGTITGTSSSYPGLFIVSQIPSIASPAPVKALATGSTTGTFTDVILPAGTYYAIVDCYSGYSYSTSVAFTLSLSATAAGPAVLAITPTTKAFGTVAINPATPPSQVFTVSNTGGGTITLSSIAKAAGSDTYFAISGLPAGFPATPISLVAGTSTTFTVTYNPTAYGAAHAATINIANNAPAPATNPATISITGNCLDPLAPITSFPFNEGFENPWIGTPPAPFGWTNINADSDANLWHQGISWITAHSGLQAADGHGNLNDWLITPPLQFTANMRLKWWDRIENTSYPNPYTVKVSTTNNQVASFTTTLGSYTSNSTTYTQRELDLSAYNGQTIYIGFYQTLSPSATMGFGIDDVLVEAIPVIGIAQITPSPLAIGNGYVTVPKSTEVTLTNIGGGSLTINSGGVSLTGDAVFTLGSITYPIVLAPAAHMHFNVNYTATAAGANTGTLHVNNGTTDVTAAITATGVAGAAGVSCELPYDITLPLVSYSGSTTNMYDDYTNAMFTPASTLLLSLDWVGRFTLAVDSKLTGTIAYAAATAPSLTIVSQIPSLGSPAPVKASTSTYNTTATFTDVLLPAGTYYAIVDNYYSSYSGTFTLSLSSVAAGPAALAITPATKDFGVVSVNPTTPPTQLFTVSNTGGGSITLSSIEAAAGSSTMYSITGLPVGFPATPITLGLGGSTTFTVTYNPTVGGTHTATINIGNNAPSPATNPATIALTGISRDPLAPITNFPYNEGFNGTEFAPFGWTNYSIVKATGAIDPTAIWTRVTSGTYNSTAGAAKCSYSHTATSWAALQTPPINLPAAHRLRYYWRDADSRILGNDTTFCEISTNHGTTWTILDQLSAASAQTGWTLVDQNLSAYAGNGVLIRFRDGTNAASAAYGTFVDELTIEAIPANPYAPTLPIPTDTATGVSTSSDLAWTINGNTTKVDVYFGTSLALVTAKDASVKRATNQTSPLTSFVLGTLNDAYSTDYYWLVVAKNDEGRATADSPVWKFTTGSDPTNTPMPYVQNFDTVTTPAMPTNWTVIDANAVSPNWLSSTTYPQSTPNCLRITYTSSGSGPLDDWAVSPGFQLTSGVSYRVLFSYRAYSSTYTEKMKVCYGSTPDVAGLTNEIWNNPGFTSTTYAPVTVDFTSTITGTAYFGWQAYSAENQYGIHVDDITIRTTPTVPEPATNLLPATLATNVSRTPTLSWTNNGLTSSVDVYLSTTQADVTSGAPAALVTSLTTGALNTYTVTTPLTYSGVYYWKVVGKNAADAAPSAVQSFTVVPDPTIYSLATAYTQNFDAVTTPALPYGWTKVGTTGSVYTQTTSNNSAPNCLYMYGSSAITTLAIPPMGLTVGTGFTFQFAGRASVVGQAIQFGYLTDPADPATFQQLGSKSMTSTTYATYRFSASTTAATMYYALRHSGTPGYSVTIDDVSISAGLYDDYGVAITTAPPIYMFAAAANTVNFRVTNYGGVTTGKIAYLSVDGTVVDQVAIGTLASDTYVDKSFTYTFASAGTYNVSIYVAADAVTTNDAVTLTGLTIYGATQLAEGFEGTWLPTRWMNWGGGSLASPPVYNQWVQGTTAANAQEIGGAKYASLTIANLNNTYAKLATPPLSFTTGTTFTFYAKTTAAAPYQQIKIMYSSAAIPDTNAVVWNDLQTFTLTNTYAPYSVNVSSLQSARGNFRIAFDGLPNGVLGTIYLDKVIGPNINTPIEAPSLVVHTAPNNNATGVDPKTVVMDWNPSDSGGNPTYYTVNYWRTADEASGYHLPNVTAPTTQYVPYTASPQVVLNYNTEYSWQVISTLQIGLDVYALDPDSTWTFRTKAQMQATGPIAIGAIAPTMQRTGTFAIQNIGDTSLTINVLSAPSTIAFGVTLPYTIPANTTYNLPYTFTAPGASGAYDQTFTLTETSPGTSSILVHVTASVTNLNEAIIGSGTLTGSYIPFYYLYDYSWSKVIVTKAELNTAGLNSAGNINSIAYNVSSTGTGRPMDNQKIYIRHTTAAVEDLNYNEPIAAGYTQCFSGNLSVGGPGWYTVTFTTPFNWDNTRNVEILWENHDGSWNASGGSPAFYSTATTTNMAAYRYQDTTFPEGTSTYSGTPLTRPNMKFVLPATTSGSLSGYVTYGTGTALVGATVTAGALSTTTDANGRYNFPSITPGSVSVQCSKIGYTSQTVSLSITQDVTTTHDFVMVLIPLVNVTGHVVDNAGAIISGAAITLGGYAPYSGTTDGSGDFSITGVISSQTYNYTISKLNHTSATGSINVLGINYNIGTITLNETTVPVTNVVASELSSNVEITWTAPGSLSAYSYDFEATNGGFVATNSPSTGWEWGTSTVGSHSGAKIWGNVLTGTYPLSATNQLVSPAIPLGSSPALTFWHRYNFETDVDGDWDGGIIQVSSDGGTNWTTITPAGDYPSSYVEVLGEAGYNGNLDTWTQANFSLTSYANSTVKFKWLMKSDGSVNWAGWFIDDVNVMGAARSAERPVITNDRSLTGYNVYRFAAADESTPAAWTEIATNVSSTSYTDTNWSTQPANTYKWAVKAVYSAGVVSSAVVSNSLFKLGVPSNIVTTSNGTSIHIAWPAVSQASGYRVYCSSDFSADFSTWTQLTLTGNTSYDYAIGDTDHMYFRIVAVKFTREEAIRNSLTPASKPNKLNHKK